GVEQYTEVVVDPNSDHTVSVELTKDEALKWKFGTEKYDINFGVRFFEESNGEGWEQIVPMKRTASYRQEQSGSFQARSSGTLVFKWDNSYSVIRSKKLRFMISPDGGNAESTESEDWDAHKMKEEEVTFENWFGVSIESLPASLRALQPRHRVMVHTQPSCRKMTKSFPATVYMSDQFPLSVTEFLPVIEVLSKTTSTFESVQEFFSAVSTRAGGSINPVYYLGGYSFANFPSGFHAVVFLLQSLTEGFPVQFCFPLVPSVSATFRFDRMDLQTPDSQLFVVPSSYTMQHEDVLSPRTHQEMLQRVTAA
ncbi:hypothetical protein BBJ28_00014920, partial [Nothophytophthora sp. Chile5]